MLVRSRALRISLVAALTAGSESSAQFANQLPAPGEFADSLNRVAYAYRGWSSAGRPWLAHYTGTLWDPQAKTWRSGNFSSAADSNLAQEVYFAEYALRPALALAESQHDRKLLDELARFYLAFRSRFVSLGQLRGTSASIDLLTGQGADDALVLPWLEHTARGLRARECQLCTGQFLYPASRIIRLIASVPKVRRTPAMQQFLRDYCPLVTRDYALRLAYEASVDRYGLAAPGPGLVALWDLLSTRNDGSRPSYRHAMLDSDLWILATASELLEAGRRDSSILENVMERARLIHIVASGARLLQSKRHAHQPVPGSADSSLSLSYFDDDFYDHPDMTYSGRGDSLLHSRDDSARAAGASWDVSHAYRIPVVLRSLAEARGATGIAYPSDAEIRLVVNQYLLRALYHLNGRPQFRAFFDGTDGWYRVTWTAKGVSGYPPPRWCDTRRANRPCLTPGALFGWGLLAASDPRLTNLMQEFVRLAASKNPAEVEFRRRYLGFASQEFAFSDANGREQPSLLLFDVIAESLVSSPGTW
jgi:hypothetical protein